MHGREPVAAIDAFAVEKIRWCHWGCHGKVEILGKVNFFIDVSSKIF
jgi:hypothetical protein